MALFNRNNRTNVPAEIQEYYQTERRERAGIAWLLALGTLVVTILLTAGIFFAGRWTYRKVAGDDNKPPSSQVAQNQNQQDEQQPVQTPDNSTEQTEEEKRAEEERQAAEERKAEEAKKAEEERKATAAREAEQTRKEAERKADEEEAARRRSAAANQRVAGANNAIPNTGPGSMVAIFLSVSILAYLLHRLYAAKSAR
ncbi:MAG TPA: hypothetical protein VK674_00310 [Candidatus Limnocylindria bacterium]|nr:hypothetical protein [Candidatus Limnocylindria bacterium]